MLLFSEHCRVTWKEARRADIGQSDTWSLSKGRPNKAKSYKEESVRIDYIPRVSPIAPWYEARAAVSLSQSEVYLAKIDFYLNIYIVFVLEIL